MFAAGNPSTITWATPGQSPKGWADVGPFHITNEEAGMEGVVAKFMFWLIQATSRLSLLKTHCHGTLCIYITVSTFLISCLMRIFFQPICSSFWSHGTSVLESTPVSGTQRKQVRAKFKLWYWPNKNLANQMEAVEHCPSQHSAKGSNIQFVIPLHHMVLKNFTTWLWPLFQAHPWSLSMNALCSPYLRFNCMELQIPDHCPFTRWQCHMLPRVPHARWHPPCLPCYC
jgi:hypothetical protein